MPNTYVVKKGDTLSGIAQKTGYKSWRDIYFSADNQAFRTKRPNPNLILPGDTLVLPNSGPAASAPVPATVTPSVPGSTSDPRKLKLFLTADDLFRIDQIIKGPGPGRNDPLRDIERALKEMGPAAKNTNGLDDLAQKVQKHMEIHAGDWTIKPDLPTIGKGILELLKKK
ncbi:MAG TPA: LysM peptidoglycan-binding domain-containing protein [Bryobacteraceae bacterium]|nr:LysM peptidoglycan-binding domain-containing protein [Bryobacteraceae bacterium]